ncbi:MAG: YraN family protein [Opitutaceae bacterium]|nr:YraN family protein [Opitutaceae bacterium]
MIQWAKNMWGRLAGGTPGATPEAADGIVGENTAADFLRQRCGYELVTRNWHSPSDRRDELDLVCRDGKVLVFVEVKARREHALVPGYYAVDQRKKRALRRAVHSYLSALEYPPRTFRFDVVEVALSDRLPPQVLHFQNVALFPKGYHVARQSGSLREAGERV